MPGPVVCTIAQQIIGSSLLYYTLLLVWYYCCEQYYQANSKLSTNYTRPMLLIAAHGKPVVCVWRSSWYTISKQTRVCHQWSSIVAVTQGWHHRLNRLCWPVLAITAACSSVLVLWDCNLLSPELQGVWTNVIVFCKCVWSNAIHQSSSILMLWTRYFLYDWYCWNLISTGMMSENSYQLVGLSMTWNACLWICRSWRVTMLLNVGEVFVTLLRSKVFSGCWW